ncbi:hypothetical protein Bhyg_09181 [Pseudolycoriella hygida]|uniref:Uncharacterized protein n=1 Tax=Pseudolycoriella hygida TaxID=35572 RepID=A0A9Q0N7U5_9DIPT|nr:hypothetical protein Bhyg_09181 [Pseudolycoriella hygida]
MKGLITIIFLSLLGLSYTSFLCDLGDNSTSSTIEVTDHGTCILLHGNNRNRKPTRPSKKRDKPSNLMDPTTSAEKGIRELVNMGEIGRFNVKHMFMDGRYGSGINSFDELAGNPEILRKYLVEVNRRMFKGNVLPVTINGRETFQKWITQASKNPKKISLVDGDLREIQQDIGEQQEFKEYLDLVKTDPQEARKKSLFTTNRKYPLTEIILTMEGDKLVVKLERYAAKLKIGMNQQEVYHWDPFDRSVMQETVNGRTISSVDVESTSAVESDGTMQTTFTREQLLENEKMTLKFWKELFNVPSVDMVGYKGPINDQAKRFSRIELKYRREWQEKVVVAGREIPQQEKVVREIPGACAGGTAGFSGAAGRCAISIDTEGEVETIQPEEFLEVFKNVDDEARKLMLKVVKGNGDKIEVNNEITAEEARRNLNQLIHHDEMTEHIELVDLTERVQDLPRWNRNEEIPKTPSEFVLAVHERITARLNKFRLSGSKIVSSLAKNPHLENFNKAGKVYGHLMVAKGIINGIIHNDTTSLAVIGGRFGYDIVTETAVKVGEKFFSTASKVGKAARVLSKVAGPIGCAIDVGLGAWAISKSVDRLKNADNKYDRDDAIADIVSESIDMAVSITVTVLSLAFPPAAPIIAAVGLIISLVNNIANSLFHASNEVARINEQFPLLEHEKIQVFTSRFLDIFGLREKDYIDYLVEEKKANDLAVTSYIEFLKNNTQFSGVVFPSRTLAYEGKCHLKHTWGCPLTTELGRPVCLYDDIIGRGCDWNRPCGHGGKYCMNEKFTFEFFDCICDGEEKTDFGFPHQDSRVDFRAKRELYWERAVPGDHPGAVYRCKPGSLRFENYKIHQTNRINDYRCENAIGLYRPEKERTSGQSYLIDLQDGNDEVYVDRNEDPMSYTFWMGEKGRKNFYGGNQKNDFILSGNCSSGLLEGILNGGPKESDSLIIATTCAKGQTIEVKQVGKFYFAILENKLNLRLEEIENIIGRPNEAEKVEVDCNTRSAYLNGGADSTNPDYIYINPSLYCRFNFQTFLGNYTNILAQQFRGDFTIYVGEDMTGSNIHIKKRVFVRFGDNPNLYKTTVIFTQTKSQEIVLDNLHITIDEVSLKLKDHSPRAPLTIKYTTDVIAKPVQQYQLIFNESSVETPNSFSSLLVPGNHKSDSTLMFFHSLPSHNGRNKIVKRTGSVNIPNLFNISGPDWDVRGGDKDDTFLLNVPLNKVKLDGGAGSNTLLIEAGQSEMINLSQHNGIQTVVKAKSAGQIEISASCQTNAIVVSGEKVPDTVRINSCSQKRELQIDAAGTARVLVEGDITGANELVQIVAHKAGQQHTTFELDTMRNKVSRLLVQIQLENDKRKLFVNELVRSPKDVNSFHVSLKGAGLNNVILKLTDNVRDDSAFISSPKINLIPPKQSLTSDMPVQLVFKRETLEPVAIHHVTDDRSSKQIVKGFEDLENLFQLQTTTNREVHGGKLKDTFIGTSKALSVVRLTAFSESDNTLIVKEDLPNSIESQTTFKIDLSENVMGLSTAGSTRQATIQGDYHHLLGRPKQPDTIVGGCMTKSIVGRGGSGKDTLDLIEFKANSSCEMGTLPNVEMYLGPYTKVDNQAEMGSFNYFVDLTQYAEYLSFAIRSTENTSNNIVFTLPSLEKSAILAIDSIKFEKERKSLTFTLRDRTTSLKVYEFQMYRKDESSEFSDPKFLFTTSEDKWVTSDVRVDKHGTVIATNVLAGDCSGAHQDTVVKGLPVNVNHFLVNMTGSGSDGSCGKVEGHTDSAENHIWLYRLPDEQHFTIVGSDKYYFRDGNLATDTLHIDKDFYSDRPLEALFKKEQSGSLAVKGVLTVGLQFIDNFEGRNDPRSYDAVIPSCSLKQVSGVDLVSILLHPHADCIYNLIVQVEPMTRVEFEWVDKENGEGIKNLVDFWNSTFYYRFSEPMSFEVVQSYPGMLDGTVHNLYLPFLLGDLETMSFDVEESKLHYTFNSEEYSITMISEPDDEDQFYPQPNMVTSDGFRIQIGRDGSVLVTKFLNDEQPPALDLLSKFQAIANTLVITMLIQTNDTFLHIGNDGSTSDRNVLQNLASTVSYMAGGGADDIYEVVSLMKDVYISTGLENASLAPAVNEEGPYISKQTIDLTDIVVPIRFKVGMKYIPFVYQDRDDLIITMREFELDHPGKVVVLNGATESVRKNLQILLSNAMMEFIRIHEGIWILSPIDIHLERETIYSIAAEDLEPNHRIYVLDHKYGREYRFRFKYTKKENDIRLSDIEELRGHKYDRQHIEMTTVIITDFFKNSSPPNMISANGTYNAPTEIRNVTIFMPGLIISLDGTEVRDHHLYESDEEDMESPFQFSSPIATIPWDSSPTTISIDMMPTWNSVIHNLENDVLEGLPFVNRTYK